MAINSDMGTWSPWNSGSIMRDSFLFVRGIVSLAMTIMIVIAISRFPSIATPIDPPTCAPKSWNVKVVDNHDGDTVTVIVDHEWAGLMSEEEIRIYGINAPELYDPGGIEAREFLAVFLPPNTQLVFTPQRLKSGKMKRSFTRYVGMLEKPVGDKMIDIAPIMFNGGHATWTDENGKVSNAPPRPLK
jgi:endonuclease YncB( thermonuclease family)